MDKVGLIVRFNKNTLIAIQDFVLWNHFQFLKKNKKKCQYERKLKQQSKKVSCMKVGWNYLRYHLKVKDKYLKQVNQVQVQEEVKQILNIIIIRREYLLLLVLLHLHQIQIQYLHLIQIPY